MRHYTLGNQLNSNGTVSIMLDGRAVGWFYDAQTAAVVVAFLNISQIQDRRLTNLVQGADL